MNPGPKKQRASEQIRPQAISQLLRRFGPHLRPHWRRLAGAGLCLIGVAAMEILRPWPLKVVFDALLMPPGNPTGALAWLMTNFDSTNGLLGVVAGMVIGVAILAGLFGYGQTYLLAGVSQQLVTSIRQQFYSHIQRLSQSFHDQRSLGDLLTRLSGDVGMMRELMVLSFMAIGERVVILAGMVTVMALMDWRLTLVAVAVLPPLSLLIRRYGREIKGASRKQRRRESKIISTFNERISAIRLVQAYAREAHEEERLAQRNNKDMQVGMLAARLEAQLERLVQVSLAFGACGVLWYGVIRVQAGAITPGDLIVFSAYLTALYRPIRKIASLTSRLSKATVAGERIVAILDIEPEIKDTPGAITAPPLRGEIEFENVSFAYQPGSPVLTDVSFRLAAGETIALTGDSGAGKSTITSLLLRFYDPGQGCIRIDGADIRAFTLASLREQISIVLQESVLFNATIRDNIAYGKLDATDEEIVAAARAANADGFIAQLSDGYDTMVGERGANLSGGQRQRIAIARAMIRNAPIVILDEPMAGLHKEAVDAVRDALANLTAGKTCLLITHDPAAAAQADRVFALRGSAIVEIAHETPPPLQRIGGHVQ